MARHGTPTRKATTPARESASLLPIPRPWLRRSSPRDRPDVLRFPRLRRVGASATPGLADAVHPRLCSSDNYGNGPGGHNLGYMRSDDFGQSCKSTDPSAGQPKTRPPPPVLAPSTHCVARTVATTTLAIGVGIFGSRPLSLCHKR